MIMSCLGITHSFSQYFDLFLAVVGCCYLIMSLLDGMDEFCYISSGCFPSFPKWPAILHVTFSTRPCLISITSLLIWRPSSTHHFTQTWLYHLFSVCLFVCLSVSPSLSINPPPNQGAISVGFFCPLYIYHIPNKLKGVSGFESRNIQGDFRTGLGGLTKWIMINQISTA